MFGSEEQRKRGELIVMLLAKLYVVLELSADKCPVCQRGLGHDCECPIFLAWSLLSKEQQHDARAAIRALALSIGNDESGGEPMVSTKSLHEKVWKVQQSSRTLHFSVLQYGF